MYLTPGAYPAAPTVTSKLHFGFDVKYQSGASVPTGCIQLTFQAANLTFVSTGYQWLVVSGTEAQFQGTGTLNGSGTYMFLITIIDGGKTGPDLIRIEIWNSSAGIIIYDNQPKASNTPAPTTAIGAGNLMMHSKPIQTRGADRKSLVNERNASGWSGVVRDIETAGVPRLSPSINL